MAECRRQAGAHVSSAARLAGVCGGRRIPVPTPAAAAAAASRQRLRYAASAAVSRRRAAPTSEAAGSPITAASLRIAVASSPSQPPAPRKSVEIRSQQQVQTQKRAGAKPVAPLHTSRPLPATTTSTQLVQPQTLVGTAATRLPFHKPQTPLKSTLAPTRNNATLNASKFSLNSSTSSLTLASVKRARKAPSPGPRNQPRASGSLAELSDYATSRRVAPALAVSYSPDQQRKPRSSRRFSSSATTDTTPARSLPAPVAANNQARPLVGYLHSSDQQVNSSARAKSTVSLHLEASASCRHCNSVACGSASRPVPEGRTSAHSGLGLFWCEESGLALERHLHSSSKKEALPHKPSTERRASFEATEHIARAAMCSHTPSTTKSSAKGKPLALNQEQQQTNNHKLQHPEQQAANNNNNFPLSHGMLEQLENQPPPVDAYQTAQNDADKMSLGSPLVTPPPCDLNTQPQPHTTCRSLTQTPALDIRTNPISDLYNLDSKPFARGKFAQVRRCVHRLSKQCFAAKCIKKRRRSTDTRHEILLEIEALKLSHATERIVKLFEVYETQTEIILVLELAKGGELQRVLDEEEQIPEPRAQRMVAQILDGLIQLHDNHIAHLDIKPQNLLLTDIYPLGDIKLCDFGISRRITKDCELRDICGTPDYVAPEILRYDPISLATDMWSLGVLTYILLSGYSPFGSDNKQQTFCNITQAELDFPCEIFDKISPDAIDFMKKLILRDPSQRLTSHQARSHQWLAKEESI